MTYGRSLSMQTNSFRNFLQEELLNRCRKNPSYSLRAFARSLSVEPSALSQIINGKRPISGKMKLRLGSALGLSSDALRVFSTGEEISDLNRQFQNITLDTFALISDWYHYAILELTHIKGFKSDNEWIAKRLGITKSEVNIAVERLFRLGLLAQNKNRNWKDTSKDGHLTHLTKSVSSSAAKKYQRQLLELSGNSVYEVDLQKRNHTSMTLRFALKDMQPAIDYISRFRREFAEKFESKIRAEEVYQLQISFFPLTKKVEETK